jgi:hypothetical protein
MSKGLTHRIPIWRSFGDDRLLRLPSAVWVSVRFRYDYADVGDPYGPSPLLHPKI